MENANVKKTSKGLVIGLVAAAIVIITAVILFIFQPWSTGYVATVDNLKVSKQEYLVLSKFNMSQFLSSNNVTSPDANYWTTTKVGSETAKDQVRKSTLDSIQEIKIQLAQAAAAGIKLDATDTKNIDDAINQRVTQSGTRAQAEKDIKAAYGVSLSEYKEVYKDLVLAQKYAASEQAKIKVTDDEVKKQYDDNKKEYDKVTVTHILISTVDSNNVPVSAGKKAEAKKKAEDLLAQVKSGADIKALAEKNSQDPGVTENKGEYTFGRGEMVSQFEDWAFKDHQPGDADIVETSYGYHVIQFQKRVETSFDSIKDTIKSTLVSKKFNEEYTKKMDAWKKDTKYAIVKNESALAKADKTLYGA